MSQIAFYSVYNALRLTRAPMGSIGLWSKSSALRRIQGIIWDAHPQSMSEGRSRQELFIQWAEEIAVSLRGSESLGGRWSTAQVSLYSQQACSAGSSDQRWGHYNVVHVKSIWMHVCVLSWLGLSVKNEYRWSYTPRLTVANRWMIWNIRKKRWSV